MGNRIKKDKFDQICRLCLEYASDTNTLFPLVINDQKRPGYRGRYSKEFKESIAAIIEACTGIKIDRTEKLPLSICSECEKELIKSNKFRRKCLKSNDYLIQIRDSDDFRTDGNNSLMNPLELIPVDNIKVENEENDVEMDLYCNSTSIVPVKSCSKAIDWNKTSSSQKLPTLGSIQNSAKKRKTELAEDRFEEAVNDTIQDKSLSKYKHSYDVFMKWRESKGINSFTETVLLDYFVESSKNYKPSTLWSQYSMLRSTIACNHNIDISEYDELRSFLIKNSEGFKSKNRIAFTVEEIKKFLFEASDDRYLAMKTILMFGVIGACKGLQMAYLKTDYVRDDGDEITVTIPGTETKDEKFYHFDGQYANIVRKYMKLRPEPSMSDRFFLNYRNGKCDHRVVGKNKIAKMPKEIAKFLKLPEHESYTILSCGVGIETVKRCRQWISGNESRKMSHLMEAGINSQSTSGEIIKSEPSEHFENTPSYVVIASQHFENGKSFEMPSQSVQVRPILGL